MEWCGLLIDQGQNDSAIGTEARISPAEASIHVFVIPSDEEAVIAGETAACCNKDSHLESLLSTAVTSWSTD